MHLGIQMGTAGRPDIFSRGVPPAAVLAGFMQTTDTVLALAKPMPAGIAAAGLSAKMGGGYAVNAGMVSSTTFNGLAPGASATFWMATPDGGYTKAVQVAMSLDATGAGITVRATAARYTGGSVTADFFNAGGAGSSVATSDAAPGYGLFNFTIAA